MSRHAWLTPGDAPSPAECRTVFIPAGLHYEAAFRGAYLLLCDPENWEQDGAQTPEACAAAFQSAFFETLDNWEVCPVSGLIVGEIRILVTGATPDGWLFCDGSLISKTTYPALFDTIGYVFGGTGGDDFGLPDIQGRFIVGMGYGAGLTEYLTGDTGVEESHALSEAEMPGHDHAIGHNHAGSRSFVTFAQGSSAGADLLRSTAGTAAVTAAHAGSSGSTGGDGSHENRPPYIALAHYIYAG